MTLDTILLILGSFISLLLIVNAYFTRNVLQQVQELSVKLAVLIAKHDSTEERSRSNEKEIDKMNEEISRIRERIHSLEGGQSQFANFIEEYVK